MPITTDDELRLAVEQMRSYGTDTALYELKSARGGFPSDAAETFSAFANTTGGTIIFGIQERSFHPVGEFDAKATQAHCAQVARELMEPPLAAEVLVLTFEQAPVVVVNVPEADKHQKPCFVRKQGRIGGSYIRTGDGDHRLTLYEIDRLIENQYRNAQNDVALVPDATMDDFDSTLLSAWLSYERQSSFNRAQALDDETLMANRRVIRADEAGTFRPTVAGIMALGAFPQKFFPRLNVVFSSYPTARKEELATSNLRFLDAVNIDGPIPEMVVNTLKALSNNMKHGAIVEGALRRDILDYPLAAVREAIANALMHRDYSPDSQGTPVLVDLYPDRLEISNPGGLYGSLTVESLGTSGSTASRNQFLSTILAGVPYTDIDGTSGHVVENRGSGYHIITGELEKALMGRPIVTSSLSEFRIAFRHRKMTEQEGISYSRANVEDAILAFISQRSSASTSEIARAAGISSKTALGYVNALLDAGLLEGIGSKYSPKRRYRLA